MIGDVRVDARCLGRGRYWVAVAGRRLARAIDASRAAWELHCAAHPPWNVAGARDPSCTYCRAAVRRLQHQRSKGMSDRAIAEHCGVSYQTVANIRAEQVSKIDTSDTPRLGRDGKHYKPHSEKRRKAAKAATERRAIAEHCGVSDKTVAAVREEMIASCGNSAPETPRLGRDGKQYKPHSELSPQVDDSSTSTPRIRDGKQYPGAILRAIEYARGHVDDAARLLGIGGAEMARHVEECSLTAYARRLRELYQ